MQRKKKCKASIPYLSKRNDVMKKFYTQTHTHSRAICIVIVVFNFCFFFFSFLSLSFLFFSFSLFNIARSMNFMLCLA